MGSLRNLSCGLVLGLAGLGQPGLAQSSPDPVPLFATCTGRLSAVMEFQWLLGDAGADLTQARRDEMESLLLATTPEPELARAMQLRLEAKFATALLLRQGLSGGPEALARNAARIERLLAACRGLIIS